MKQDGFARSDENMNAIFFTPITLLDPKEK